MSDLITYWSTKEFEDWGTLERTKNSEARRSPWLLWSHPLTPPLASALPAMASQLPLWGSEPCQECSASKFPRVLSLPAFRSSLRCHFSVTPWRESQLPSHFLSPLSASVFLPRACHYLKDNKFYALISFAYCLILIRTGMFVSFLHCRPWSTSNKAWIEFKEITLGQDKTNKAREISDRRQIPAGSRGLVITQIPGALREILIQDVRNGVWTSEFLTGIPVILMQPAESSSVSACSFVKVNQVEYEKSYRLKRLNFVITTILCWRRNLFP